MKAACPHGRAWFALCVPCCDAAEVDPWALIIPPEELAEHRRASEALTQIRLPSWFVAGCISGKWSWGDA